MDIKWRNENFYKLYKLANKKLRKYTEHMPNKTPQEIVNAAYKYMQEVMQAQISKISNPRVEELTSADEGAKKIWNVVLSYDIVGDFAFDKTREYKQFRVDDDGVVLDMKIKKIL